MIFVDTGAWFAAAVPSDPNHPAASRWLAGNNEPLLTTDYIVDETLTLLRARGERRRACCSAKRSSTRGWPKSTRFLKTTSSSRGNVFRRFDDKDWSFTDCTSKVVIERLGIARAFAFDHHFAQFGTVQVVP